MIRFISFELNQKRLTIVGLGPNAAAAAVVAAAAIMEMKEDKCCHHFEQQLTASQTLK